MNLHFDKLTESTEYTLKNLKDALLAHPDAIKRAENKIVTVQEAFNSTWHIDEKLLKKQFYDFKKQYEKDFDVINLIEIDKYHHLRIFITTGPYGDYFSNDDKKSLAYVYMIFYHLCFQPYFPSYFNKYTMPYILDGQYVLYITFDEEEIDQVNTVTSDNMYDITEPLLLETIHFTDQVFTKLSANKQL